VPDAPTVTWTLGCSSLKSSPAASANGKTVDEPSIRIVPASSSLAPAGAPASGSSPPPPPHAATPIDSVAATAANAVMNRVVPIDPSFSFMTAADPRRPPADPCYRLVLDL
jgi:hypothetical protein